MRKDAANLRVPLPTDSASQNVLTVQLRKRFSNAGRDFTLDALFNIAPGITIIFGSSGAGKTTLLDCIAGLTVPDSGKIAIGDRVLCDHGRQLNLPAQSRKL